METEQIRMWAFERVAGQYAVASTASITELAKDADHLVKWVLTGDLPAEGVA